MTKRQRLPAKLRPVVKRLRLIPGVVGVFWGLPRRGRGWAKEPALCVHVRRKWHAPPDEHIARTYHGYPTDVLAVGDIRHHSVLDTDDQVESATTRSSIAALARDSDGKVMALLSGHGTLRAVPNGFEAGPWGPNQAPWVNFVDDRKTRQPIELVDGAVTPKLDFALGFLLDTDGEQVLLGHRMSGLPIEVRRTPLGLGERLLHFSAERGLTLSGQVVNEPSDSFLHDGVGVDIDRPITVRPSGSDPFSVEGDSGSLVFDEERRAVGFVVAGAENHVVSYLVPINRAFSDRMADKFRLFFEVKA